MKVDDVLTGHTSQSARLCDDADNGDVFSVMFLLEALLRGPPLLSFILLFEKLSVGYSC